MFKLQVIESLFCLFSMADELKGHALTKAL